MTYQLTFSGTHPWLTFGLDTRLFDHELWMALGEASSKCEHIAGVPLAPEVSQKFYSLYLAKGALATTAIEGNTLSELEAQEYLEGRLKLPPSRQYLGKELENIVRACNTLTREILERGAQPLFGEKIKWMNAQVLEGLELDEGVLIGEIRRHFVTVGRYRCPRPEECPHLLEKLCDTLNEFSATGPNQIALALIKAIFAHLYLVWIHPFGDGNGRTARLLEFYILAAAGLPQPTVHLLSNHYNKTRNEYYRQLDKAREPGMGATGFIKYAIEGFLDGLREQLKEIRDFQWSVAWINYIHSVFQDKNSEADIRRRNLILNLSRESDFVTLNQVQNLSPILAVAYADKTARTVSRDINALIEMGLIERQGKKVRARREKIIAFLPWRNPGK